MVLYPKVMQGIYSAIEYALRERGVIAGMNSMMSETQEEGCEQMQTYLLISSKSGRHMKYPYTISAKIAQFPYFFYMKHNNIWMYYPLGWIVGFYFISKIHRLANSEENKRSWAETQRKAAEKEARHH